jgi:hypothetical protein
MIGLNFSPWHCKFLGIDHKYVLDQILKLKPKYVRISAYWNLLEVKDDVFEWEKLDELISILNKNDIKIILTVGLKAQRWPEVFIPHWLAKEYKTVRDFQQAIKDPKSKVFKKVAEFITEVMKRYDDNVEIWQIENEPILRPVPLGVYISPKFYLEEVKVAKKLTKKKIITNHFFSMHRSLGLVKLAIDKRLHPKHLDGIDHAHNIYHTVAGKFLNMPIIINASLKFKAKEPSIFTEIQAEPWPVPTDSLERMMNKVWERMKVKNGLNNLHEFGGIVPLEADLKNPSFFPDIMHKSYKMIEGGKNHIYLFWGAEYWIHRQLKHKDDSWIKSYNRLVKENGHR